MKFGDIQKDKWYLLGNKKVRVIRVLPDSPQNKVLVQQMNDVYRLVEKHSLKG